MTFEYKPYEGNEPYVFISYCREDSELCNQIIKFLAGNGIRVWYDNAIHVGDMWPDVIADHLLKSRACVLVITEGFVRSINCNKELVFSYKYKIPTVPIVLDGTNISPGMDLMISAAQYIKIKKDGPLHIEKLLESQDILACKGGNVPTVKRKVSAIVIDADAGKAYVVPDGKAALKAANGTLQVSDSAEKALELICNDDECVLANMSGQYVYLDGGMIKPGERTKVNGETWIQLENKTLALLCGEAARAALREGEVGVLGCALSREKKCVYSSVLVLGTDHVWPKGTLSDQFIARENSLVIRRDGKFILKDAAMGDTAFGTIVNHVFLEAGQEHALKTGDMLQLGETLLRFETISVAG